MPIYQIPCHRSHISPKRMKRRLQLTQDKWAEWAERLTEEMNRRITSTELRDALSDVVNRVAYGGECLVVERHGKELAALISVEDLVRIEALDVTPSSD